MKKNVKKVLSLFLTLLMVMSSWVFVAPVSAAEGGPAYGMGTVDPADNDAIYRIRGTGDAADYFTMKYPSEMYLDKSETFEGVGYQINLTTHYGSSGDYRILALSTLWGGQSSDSDKEFGNAELGDNTVLLDNFTHYGIIYTDGNLGQGWVNNMDTGKGSNACYFCESPSSIIGGEADGSGGQAHWKLKGLPKSTGDFTYNLAGQTYGLLDMQEKTGRIWRDFNGWGDGGDHIVDAGNGKGTLLSEDLNFTIHVYDKAALNSLNTNVNNFKTETGNNGNLLFDKNNDNYIIWDNYITPVDAALGTAQATLTTRKVLQEKIDTDAGALGTTAGTPSFKADNSTLLAAIDAANERMAETDYEAKYTEYTKNKLETALYNAKQSPLKTETTVYTAYIAKGKNLDAAAQAGAEQAQITALTEELTAAVDGLREAGNVQIELAVSPETLDMHIGDVTDIDLTVKSDGVETQNYVAEWSVDPSGVVSVGNGRITAIGLGTATVKVRLTSVNDEILAEPVENIVIVNVSGKPVIDTGERLELNFNKNWKFILGNPADAQSSSFNDEAWRTVNLPHDFSIEQQFTTNGTEVESGNLPGGTGWYRKTFTVPESESGKTFVLNFDGSYKDTYVYVNGEKLCENHYGYNAFSVDITDNLTCDGVTGNVIAVKVDHQIPSSRWYSGGGIYRDVTMTITNPVHVALYGTKVTMPELQNSGGSDGQLSTVVTVRNDSASSQQINIKNILYDAAGNNVSESAGYVSMNIPAHQELESVPVINKLSNPDLWDTEYPNLYTLKTEITDADGTLLDTYETKIGYRWFNWDKDNGFSLNGNNMKIQGVCMHHDQGALGAVQEYDAIYRQMKILKDMGVNAVRTSHNTASRVLLDVCNELGLLVMEEFFDGWDAEKNYNSNDFHSYFNTVIGPDNGAIGMTSNMKWYEFVVTETIKRDRNDPSIVIWSMGNELGEGLHGGSTTFSLGYDIKNLITGLDNRPVTHGNNKSAFAVDQYADVIGGNYNLSHWGKKNNAGGKPFIGSETASAVNSRGVYKNGKIDSNPDYKNDNDHTLNSYDNSWVGWGNSATEAWNAAITNDWFSGEFVWTGFDYIGEPTPWNNEISGASIPVSSYFGIIDTAGFGKDSYYLYRSWWNQDKTLHLVPGTWDASELHTDYNGFTDVAVYSNADHIKLYLDGTEIGSAQSTLHTTGAGHTYKTWSETPISDDCNTHEFYGGAGHDLYAQFKVRQTGSVLTVKAFDENNNDITDQCTGLKKAVGTQATKIVAKTWSNVQYTADGDSYIYVEFEAQDNLGNFVNNYNGTLDINVEGEGLIKGVDNGNSATTDKFQQTQVLMADRKTAKIDMFNGRALAIVGTTEQPGTVRVTANTRDNTPVNELNVESKAEQGKELTDEFEEVFPQGEILPPDPTLQDNYNAIRDKINALPPNTGSLNYVRYTANSSNTPVADGNYIIYNHTPGYPERIMDNGRYAVDITTINNGQELNTSAINEYTFTRVGNNQYTIQNSAGKYLNMSDQGGSLDLTDTYQVLNVYSYPDGRICVEYGGQLLDQYKDKNPPYFDTWQSEIENADENRKMTLYSAPTGSNNKQELYNALKDGIQYEPGSYSNVSYNRLLDALNTGYEIYNRADASETEINNSVQEIRNAIAGLSTATKKFGATLFKYGYDNTSGKNYNNGGKYINQIAIKELKEKIKTNELLLNQIKTLIGYDTEAWSSQTEKDKALDDVITLYAKIYSIQFTNDPVTGATEYKINTTSDKLQTTDINTVPMTAWNVWCKTGSQDVNAGELGEEGASVQGLASATLGSDGVLASHEPYPDALPYGNKSERDGYNTTTYDIKITRNGHQQEINLVPLAGISPYFTELFKKETLLTNGTVTEDTTGSFAKYYWDTSFPFLMSTDENGINSYSYNSADPEHIIQASYNDAAHTVEMNLNETDQNWSVRRSGQKPDGKGFFPFNYQNNAQTLTGENAIYHYGMTFSTSFSIPQGGHYKGAENEDIIFHFSGDDDVYVYIDDVLVLDNGGLHGARTADINFTQKSVSYQYAMDVKEGELKNPNQPNTLVYKYGEANPGISADNQAALEKLNNIVSSGEEHTLTFFFLERGSTDSNCEISFNLQETSSEIKLEGQSLVLDYGLPVEFDIKSNNYISDKAKQNGAKVEYLGIAKVNERVTDAISKSEPSLFMKFINAGAAEEDIITLNKDSGLPLGISMRGVFTMDRNGKVTYEMDDMNFFRSDTIYVVARVSNDPTYESGSVYYQYERITFVPATTIYYEDNFKGTSVITYTDGTINPDDVTDLTKNYGKWTEKGVSVEEMKQAADLVGDPASNIYGYDPLYASGNNKTYSAGSAHYVNSYELNNPYLHGETASYPKATFTFTGTGFDVISLTNNQTGVIEVKVYQGENTYETSKVKDYLVDTYYGYKYGRIYADENGNPTFDSNGTVMYESEKGTCTANPMYYDENNELTKVNTGNPAFAYGWLIDNDPTDNTLYQIPVIKSEVLDYGKYTVEIIPTYNSFFGHSSNDGAGNEYYGFYLDAVRIYNSAVSDDKASESAYNRDKEADPDYLEIKNLLIAANSLGDNEKSEGIVFIDGISACDDIEKYKTAGPNNELYLAKGQTVAFELQSDTVPADIQIGAKLVQGVPELTITNGTASKSHNILTATDMYYSFNSLLPENGHLTWEGIKDSAGNTIGYKTNIITIQNTSEKESILSLTNIKSTYAVSGNPSAVQNKVLRTMVGSKTATMAMSSIKMLNADLNVTQTEEPVVENGYVNLAFTTSEDVTTLQIKDSEGNIIIPAELDSKVCELDGRQYKEWKVTLAAAESGTYTYEIFGEYNNGYIDKSNPVKVVVTVENSEDSPENIKSFFERLTGFFRKIKEFFNKLFEMFGIVR